MSDLEAEVSLWEDMKKEIEELEGLSELSGHDPELRNEIEERIKKLEKKYSDEEFRLFLSGEYDTSDAYLSVYSGAGGLDAQDWTEMLLRMYQHYVERKGYKVILHDTTAGAEGGIKEAAIEIQGRYAYGFLKGESGVHRLVRISPYSAQKLRHTSFAAVDVVPKIEKVEGLEIPEEDLRIDTFRSSGPGGQNVNKRETAVRATHTPTGISASSQNERSQASNKEKALQLLRSKLYMVKIKEQKEKLEELKQDSGAIEWGSQIRSYVLHPYQLVKDHRTNVETSNVDAVLDGDLDAFIDEEVKTL